MSEPTEAQIAWAAGIFEGEGCIMAVKKTAVKLSVEMTDLDVLEAFQMIVGAGNICHKTCTNPKPQWKARYHWQVYNRDDVERILRAFLPWLLSRRRAKAEAMLDRLADNPGRHADKTHCVNGHEFTPDNIYRWSRQPNLRICRTCHRQNAKARYHRLKDGHRV